ncbi:cytochrome c oxidase subunit IVB [Bacillus sp. V2I10]|uniref:cytochrome c oxidase subunit IVB n=1 Tax=Bacillus sp. V2I10 TaxID=3042276 RepID=UPI00277EB9F6|nr:cytochrome c oxidase subunit IVB [Bacillus sp. V2I10]MDQ0860272.1 cytochrome c oxidase subunit 4 [Bacillus sp. V2I10]
MAANQNSGNPKVDLAYRRKKNKEDMKFQVVTFALMIFLTVIAFVAIGYDGIAEWFKIPFILLLAVIQVIFQLYYFMHMSHKGHEVPALFLYSGIGVAFLTVLTFMTIIWW